MTDERLAEITRLNVVEIRELITHIDALTAENQRLRAALEFAAALIAKIPYEHVAEAHMTSAIACDQPPETYIRHALEASDG